MNLTEDQQQRQFSRKVGQKLSRLPASEYLKRASTAALKSEFFRQRQFCTLLGQSLRAKFGGGGGNPVLMAYEQGEITKEFYQLLNEFSTCLQDLFVLFQIGWPYLEKGFSLLDDAPTCERQLFMRVLEDIFNPMYQRCLKGYKQTVSKQEQFTRLGMESFRTCIGSRDFMESPALRKKLLGIAQAENSQNFWLDASIGILEMQLDDSSVKQQLLRVMNSLRSYLDSSNRVYQHHRKYGKSPELQSHQWIDGNVKKY